MFGVTVLCVLVALPPLAALGHDLYIAFFKDGVLDLNNPFQPSDIGWLWQTYDPASYDWAFQNIDPATWSGVVDPLLHMTAMVAAAVPAIFVYMVLIGLKIVGVGPFEGSGLMAAMQKAQSGKSKQPMSVASKGFDQKVKAKKSKKLYNRK